MSKKETIDGKKYIAKILYTKERLPQNVCAKRSGISVVTMSKWVKEYNWDKLRRRLLTSKEEQINQYYEELEEISDVVRQRPAGKRYVNSKEADIRIKITAAIKNLETEMGIDSLVNAGKSFLELLTKKKASDEIFQAFTHYWNLLIEETCKK